jgi:hypothetical protein
MTCAQSIDRVGFDSSHRDRAERRDPRFADRIRLVGWSGRIAARVTARSDAAIRPTAAIEGKAVTVK